MKKTIILSAIVAGSTVALADDLLAPTDGSVLTSTYANQSVIMSGTSISFSVDGTFTVANMYAKVDGDGNVMPNYTKPTSLTMDFGETGMLVTTTSTNTQWGGSFNPSNSLSALTFKAEVTSEQLNTVQNGFYTRTLISGATDYTQSGGTAIWNLSRVTNTVLTLDSGSSALYTSANRVYLKDSTYYTDAACTTEMAVGQVGVYLGTNDAEHGTNAVTLVARTPEPATATLSLLALAGLAARRRRK